MTQNPSKKASAFAASTTLFHKVDSLRGGTSAMRAAGQELLPKHPEEADENYKKRLSTSTLVNYYNKAIDSAVGRSLAKPIEVTNLPAPLTPFLADIDGAGSTFDQFAQEALWLTIHHGSTYIVADYPTLEALPTTLAQANTINARPYLVSITAPQVLAAYAKSENGQERLCHFRWSGCEVIPSDDGLEEQRIETVKAYNQPDANGQITLTTWRKIDSGWSQGEPAVILGVSSIPVVCAYGWRTGFFTGKPVLTDLADLNVAHWQSLSEQTHILSIARVPFLHVSGQNLNTLEANADGSSTVKPFKLSVHSAAITPENAKIEWVETSGSSISAGAENVDYLERKMDSMGLVPTASKSGNVTATETSINAAESSAQLKSLCVAFGQSLSKALYLLSEFAGTPAPTVNVAIDPTFQVIPEAPEKAEEVSEATTQEQ
jgi:hypothetical protein